MPVKKSKSGSWIIFLVVFVLVGGIGWMYYVHVKRKEYIQNEVNKSLMQSDSIHKSNKAFIDSLDRILK